MYNIALVDDDQRILQIVQYKVKSIFNSVGIDPTITCFNNPQKLHMDTYYDVLFLYIEMPSLNGIELAQNYLQNHNDTTIIFITNKYDLVFNAFSVHPFDFVKKENLETGLIQPIKHLISKLNRDNRVISLQDKNGLTTIKCKKILYCESYGHICYIHTTDRVIKTNKYKLSNIESIINCEDFYMINQSYLVHWKYVINIENKSTTLEDGTVLPISKRRFKDSLASYKKYTFRNI